MLKQQKPIKGFFFAMLTVIAWGSVPIAIKQVIQEMDVNTLIFYRSLVAAIFIYCFLAISKKNIKILSLRRRVLLPILVGIIGLACNFLFFSQSVQYIPATDAQITSQLSPYLMMVLSFFIFKERIYFYQKIGAVIMIIGILLFFNERFLDLFYSDIQEEHYLFGLMLAILAAILWTLYGITQKILLRYYNGQEILCIFYTACAVIFLPAASLNDIHHLSSLGIVMFIYCCLNTIIGYGSYAEALDNWELSKVSAVIALTPIFTLVFSILAYGLMPNAFERMQLNMLGYIGAVIVVVGVLFTAIGHKLVPNWNR